MIRDCRSPIGTVDAAGWLCFNRPVETDAYIALGSNRGDREFNLLRAVAEIGKMHGCRVTGVSAFYETSPVGVIDQPSFYNGVLRLATELPPANCWNGCCTSKGSSLAGYGPFNGGRGPSISTCCSTVQ